MEQQYYIQITSAGKVFGISGCPVTGKNIAQNIKVSKEIYNMIADDENKYMYNINMDKWIENPNYEEEKEAEKRTMLDRLSLTAADVERAIYKAKRIDFEDIIEMVKGSPDIDLKALKIELKANNFYRGNPYVNQISTLLGFSSNQLDEFFKTGGYEALITPEDTKEEKKGLNYE